MSRSDHRLRRPKEISNIPLSSPTGTRRRLNDPHRKRGVVESGHRTKVVGQRRRAAAWRGIALVALVVGGLIAASFLWVGWRTVSVERRLGEGIVGAKELRSVIRDRVPDSGAFTLAVVTTRAGALDTVGLVTIDPDSSRAFVQGLPANASIAKQTGVTRLGDAFGESGPTQVVAALESVAATEVVGYVEIDADKASELASGWTTPSADAQLSAKQRAVVLPVMRTLAESQDTYGLLALGRQAPGVLRTTMGTRELTRLSQALGKVKLAGARFEEMPSSQRGEVVVPDAAATRAQARDLAAGKAQVATLRRVKPAGVTVEIRNGIGVTGVGADAARRLTSAGYRIGDVGNAAQFVYKETLVVHKGNESAAVQVAKELPVGRVIESRGMYAFKGDVLVVVGKDWLSPR